LAPPLVVAAAKRDRAAHVRAVLWDLDGTLTDSVQLVVDTMNTVIAAHGGPQLEYEHLGGMTGQPLDAMFRTAWPDLSDDDVARYRIEYRAVYERDAVPMTRLFRGARSTLHAFHAAGLRQASVTGKRAADCERILRGLGIKRDIDVYLGGDSVERPKPAPDLAQHAMARLGVAPSDTIVVGDSAADIAMGRSAGARTIQVLWGYAREPLPDADVIVRTWVELRALVLGSAARRPGILRSGGPLRS